MIKRAVASLILAACIACTDYSSQIAQIEERTAELRADADKMNDAAQALSLIVGALSEGTCVESVIPVESSDNTLQGFILVFEGGASVTVGNTMCDASVVEESGAYFWVIQETRYPISDDAPLLQFRAEGGALSFSADDGESWCAAGGISEPIFKGISEDAASVVLSLADGGTIVLPKVQNVGMKLHCDYNNVAVGDSVEIVVSLSGFSNKADVLAVVPDGWRSRVEMSGESCKVVVKPLPGAEAGEVVVFASDGKGKGVASSVKLGVIGSVEPDDPEEPDDPVVPDEPVVDTVLEVLLDAYRVGGGGGQFDVEISTNVKYTVYLSHRWLSMMQTKSVREDVISFSAAPNPSLWPRAATITFEAGEYSKTIMVVQDPALQSVEEADESGYIKLVQTSRNNVTIVSNGTYEFTVTTTGHDPYCYTEKLPFDLHTDLGMVTFEYKCNVALSLVQIFMGYPISEERSIRSLSLSASSEWKTASAYIGDIRESYNWGKKGDCLRIDPGNDAGVVFQVRNIRFRAMTETERRKNVRNRIELRSDRIRLVQDLTCGGAISCIAKAGSTNNYVNIYDRGRYIQQSYYAGHTLDLTAQGQSPNWSPWQWNPIQVGDYMGNSSTILDFDSTSSSSYVKCVPLRWDMNNVPAEAVMEQWTSVADNLVTVHNKITINRKVSDGFGTAFCGQELPAVYPIADLKHLYAYVGENPFTTDALPSEQTVVTLQSGFWGRYDNVPEKWMAFIGDDGYGMAVYTPSATYILAGRSGMPYGGSNDGSTSYIAPVKSVKLPYRGEYEYTYYLIMGDLSTIRSTIYELHDRGF